MFLHELMGLLSKALSHLDHPSKCLKKNLARNWKEMQFKAFILFVLKFSKKTTVYSSQNTENIRFKSSALENTLEFVTSL